MIEQELWDAYCSTVVVFTDTAGQAQVVSPTAQKSGTWIGDNASDEILIISAANPYSELMSDEANLELELRMKAQLDAQGFHYRDCQGQSPDGQWVERSVMVFNAPLEVIKQLGTQYQQNAIFRWTAKAWECISLVSDQHFVSGWQLESVD
jgi:Protein of unknown function (DUF3293)